MELILKLFIALNISVVFYTVWKRCIYRGGIEIDHVFLFSLGYIYYFIIPIFCGCKSTVSENASYGRMAFNFW